MKERKEVEEKWNKEEGNDREGKDDGKDGQ